MHDSSFGNWVREAREAKVGTAPTPAERAEIADRVLACEIELIWMASGETDGAPRMTAWLAEQGFEVNHERVARIMRELGIEG